MTKEYQNSLQKIEDKLKSVQDSMASLNSDIQKVKSSVGIEDENGKNEINNGSVASNQTFIFLKIIMESLPFP